MKDSQKSKPETPPVQVRVGKYGTKLYDQISDAIQNPTPQKIQKILSEHPNISTDGYEPDVELIISQNKELLKEITPEDDLMTWIACHSNIAFSSLSIDDKKTASKCADSLQDLIANHQLKIDAQLKSTIKELIEDIQDSLN